MSRHTRVLRSFVPMLLVVGLFPVPPRCSAEAVVFPRGEVSLNGGWEAVTVDTATDVPPVTGWEAQAVPGTRRSDARGGTRWTWYRRSIYIPPGWRGRRVFLRLVGARFGVRVFLDGRRIGQRLEGWTPFEVDLAGVEAGRTYGLAVCCQDWSAAFVEGYAIPAEYKGDPRDIGEGRIIAPIGGHFAFYGIWDDVWLESRPRVYLDDVAIQPSWRRGRLAVAGVVPGGEGDLTVAGDVLGDAGVVLRLPPTPVVGGAWHLSAATGEVRWWSPETPVLHTLRLTLRRGGEVLDVREERFGFRELWAEGPDFFLNGVKRHLLATSTWPSSGPQTREEVRRNLEAIKAGNNVAFRLHTQPWQEQWLEEADEVGLMIVEEGALWCDGSGSYGYNDERFWDNTWVHLAGMVRRDRNHASLVMWSLENEILHCGAGRYADDVEERLAELGRRVRELDPSHLITYEADLDPGGVADVIGLHYPHEMPANHDYPNTADWLDRQVETGVDGGLLGSRRKGFRWDRRKPLYVGEYLWVPYQDFSPGSVFFGDEAYEDRTEYHRRSQAEAWRHQTLAYRRSGVSATCPWTAFGSGGAVGPRLLYDTQAEVYEPLAAYLHDLDCRFFAGEAVRRMFDVFNDSVFEQEVALAWSLEGTASSGTVPLRLSPADYQPVEVTVAMPAVEEPREFVLGWELRRGGEAVHRGRRTVRVYPRHSLRAPAGIRLLAYDPAGEWSRRAAADGLSLVAVASLGDLERLDPHGTVLVVAPDAFRPAVASGGIPRVGEERSDGSTLIGFLGRGGRALVLEQSTYDGIPLGVSLLDHASTLTFLQAADHPLFDGLEADDGMFWRGDHYVSRREFRRPTAGGIRALLVSGGERCLDQSPLLEVPAGAGSALLVQALVGTKMSTEPAARRILQNALDVLAVERPPRPRTVVLSADAAFRAALGRLRIDAEFLSVPPGPADLADAGLVILHGGGEGIAASSASLRSYLEASGSATVYWHAPDEGTFARVSGPLGASGFRVQSSAGPVTVRPRLVEVFPGLCREDLMFAGSASGGESWKRPFAADPAVIDRALLPVASVGGTTRIEAESMALEGRYVSVTADGTGVTFATVGTGTFSFAAAEAGLYPVVVHAGGTPAAGVFPLVVLRHGNETLAQISLTQGEQKAYPSMVELPAGVCELRLAYTNDLQADREDRNLVLDAIQIGHRPLEHAAAELLTLPPAVALLPCGRGRLVVDCVRWDRNPRNETKARRYASALLAGLGASFAPPVPEPSWVPAAAFELEGSSGHFEKTGTELRYRSQGVCRAAFECVRAGSYEVVLRGWSNEVQGVYGRANVVVDGRAVGEVEVASTSSQTFAVGRLDALGTGTHTVEVTFTNDIWEPPLDRNLTVEAVGFRAAVVR